MSVEAYVKELVATIGENMSVRRTAQLSAGEGLVADYIHNKAADGLGKVGVLVALESKGKSRRSLPPSAGSSPCTSPRRAQPR